MARMEMDCILKKWGYRKFIASVSENSYNFDYGLFFLVNSLDIFLLVFYQYFVYGKGT